MSSRTIQPQDPSASPTFNLSQPNAASNNIAAPAIPSSLRRNLFSSHLSRRPAAPQQTSSSDTLPDPFQTTPVAFTRQASYGIFAPTQPALSPTSQHYHPPTFDPFAPAVSPKRSLSSSHLQPPTATATANSTSILQLDPSTGRPTIPTLPTLPTRLPLSSDDEDEDEEPADPVQIHLQEVHQRHRDYAPPTNIDFSSSTSALNHGAGDADAVLNGLIDATAESEYLSYERIERVLSEMQAQQRARARQLPHFTFDGQGVASGVSTRSRGKTKALEPLDPRNGTRGGGVGATIPHQEKEELLGLIMTSLGRKVALMEEESWMFGDSTGDGEVGNFD